MPRTHTKKMHNDKVQPKAALKGKKGGIAMQQHSQSAEQGINPFVGAAVGAAVGGVVGAAAAVALSDKNTREKVKEVATNLRDQAAVRLEDITSKAKETAKVAKNDMQHRLQDANKEERTE